MVPNCRGVAHRAISCWSDCCTIRQLDFPFADSASLRVYVGNLSWGVDSEMLAPHMAAAGTVQNADVMLRRDGKSKVCAKMRTQFRSVAQLAFRRVISLLARTVH